ncbi:MAG: twin-arginine translocase TatA/TatE family subunit, partial [Euryarchaeota archaeon]|nr:twin-arginine translocase TatA/TatE family subunit [Euryarchaeota archaeon]
GFGSTELIIIFAALKLLFGAAKLPELARSICSQRCDRRSDFLSPFRRFWTASSNH